MGDRVTLYVTDDAGDVLLALPVFLTDTFQDIKQRLSLAPCHRMVWAGEVVANSDVVGAYWKEGGFNNVQAFSGAPKVRWTDATHHQVFLLCA